MFGSRKHRQRNPLAISRVEQPLTAATADPNAATAAAAVFRRHESNPSLSAAAAAAALRARPMTPTRVADVQTKRTVRRSASVASAGAASDRQGQPALHRRGSSGSMSERTFRTPSPHRPGSSGSARRSVSYDTPPVPALPGNLDATSSPPGAGTQQVSQHQKASNMGRGTAPLRLASQKLASGDAPSWFSAARMGDPGNVHRTDPAMASPPSSPLQIPAPSEEPADGARPSSQASSINFSYPARARVNSLPSFHATELSGSREMPVLANQPQSVDGGSAAPIPHVKQPPRAATTTPSSNTRLASLPSDQALVYDPNSRRMVPQADLLAIQQAVLGAAQQPIKRKKKTPQKVGSHLAAGTMGRTKSVTALTMPEASIRFVAAPAQGQQLPDSSDALSNPQVQTDVDDPAIKTSIGPLRTDAQMLEEHGAQEAAEPAQIIVPAAVNLAMAATDATSHAVRRQPSVVKEEQEPGEMEPEKIAQKTISDALDAVPGRQRMHPWADAQTSPRPRPIRKAASPTNAPRPDADPILKRGPALLPSIDISEEQGSKSSTARPAQVSRTHSNSPPRQAHFGPVQDKLTIKHSPPQRSISPRKSALKRTGSSRGASPSGNTSEASGSINQEPLVARKKSVRVSFEDGNTSVTGESTSADRSDSTVLAKPPHPNLPRWLSHLGHAKKEFSSLQDEEMMKPRPALPSFGSVRDRKPRDSSLDLCERPLVRPRGETRYTSPLLPSPPLGQSSDHAVGGVLSKEHDDGSRHTANTSRLREPLPPVVTSVEGTGYESDSSSTSSLVSSVAEQPGASVSTIVRQSQPTTAAKSQIILAQPIIGPVVNSDNQPASQVTKTDDIEKPQAPAVSVRQPMLAVVENKSLGQLFAEIPGGFPEEGSDQSTASGTQNLSPVTMTVTHTDATPQSSLSTPVATEVPRITSAESSSDSESSIYSDAYEDLSEVDGDGFQSLDAVVVRPMQNSSLAVNAPRQTLMEPPVPKHHVATPKLQTDISSATTAVETPPPESPQDEWERVKAYWRSLSAEQRAQLEREAREEAGMDADVEEAEPEAKPRKKKTVERRNSQRKVLAAHVAQQMQREEEKAPNPERSYMIKPGSRWDENELAVPAMRKTMRGDIQQQQVASSADKPRLRKSMRASGAGVSSPESATAGTRRPISPFPASVAPPIGAIDGELTTTEIGTNPQPARRQNSAGSESSFKRSRPGSQLQGFGLRQSLRPTSPDATQDTRPPRRFSLRALSPSGAASGQTAEVAAAQVPSNNQIRRTLRGSSVEKNRPTGIRMPSFGLPYGGKKSGGSSAKTRTSSGPRFSSRFADSSDEEGGGIAPTGFRSRFADSSDDDESIIPIPVPVSKTLPTDSYLKGRNSTASTALPEELEESEDAKPAVATRSASQQLTQSTLPVDTTANTSSTAPVPSDAIDFRRSRSNRSGRGQLLGTTAPSSSQAAGVAVSSYPPPTTTNPAPMRRQSRRDRLLMSVLRRRKSGRPGELGKIGRGEVIESPARRDTPLERSMGELRGLRRRPSLVSEQEVEPEAGDMDEEKEKKVVEAPPRSPRLRKKRLSAVGAAAAASTAAPPSTGGAPVASKDIGARGDIGGGYDAERGNEAGGLGAADVPSLYRLSRSSTSENLGTRTLSAGNHALPLNHHHHQQQPQQHRRVMSMSLPMSRGAPSIEEGSVAGGSSLKKKRFVTLRRMFGLSSD